MIRPPPSEHSRRRIRRVVGRQPFLDLRKGSLQPGNGETRARLDHRHGVSDDFYALEIVLAERLELKRKTQNAFKVFKRAARITEDQIYFSRLSLGSVPLSSLTLSLSPPRREDDCRAIDHNSVLILDDGIENFKLHLRP